MLGTQIMRISGSMPCGNNNFYFSFCVFFYQFSIAFAYGLKQFPKVLLILVFLYELFPFLFLIFFCFFQKQIHLFRLGCYLSQFFLNGIILNLNLRSDDHSSSFSIHFFLLVHGFMLGYHAIKWRYDSVYF